MRGRRWLRVLVVGTAAVTVGCSGSASGPAVPVDAPVDVAVQPIPAADDIDPARLEPLLGFGPCPEEPSPSDPEAEAAVADLPLPAEASVALAGENQGLRNAQGTSPRTPVEIMVDYLRLEGWTPLNIEDEVFESELLVERDGMRVFLKAQAVCERGSAWVMFASDDPALVPAPAGATAGGG